MLDDDLKVKILNTLSNDVFYTKVETDARIQGLLGSAPENMDTLQELATALNNDINFASTMVTNLSNKVDKVTGKQLSTEDYTTLEKTKLTGIATGANAYIHPTTHPPSIIVQDASNRFVTDTLMTSWTSAVTHIADLIKHITSAERTLWNGKANSVDVYVKAQISTFLALKSDTTHDHDGRYNTKAEIITSLSTKSDSSHNHDTVYAIKATETTVATHTGLLTGLRTDVNSNIANITTLSNNMANGDMHANISILSQLTQTMLTNWNSAVTHIADAVKHITGAERTLWNTVSSKVATTTFNTHTGDTVAHMTSAEKTTLVTVSGKADKSYVDSQDTLKVDTTTFTGHTNNSTIHVTGTDKTNWDGKIEITQGEIQPTIGYWFKEII